jgi:peptidoglycan/LPS O-acetylase OafA/YrhL
MAAIALGPAWLLWPFVNRPVRRLGELSFGLYLMHVPIGLYAAAALGLPSDGGLGTVALWVAVVFPASLVYPYASLRLVERPARRWGRGFEQREAAPTRPAAASARAPLTERRGAEARG